MRTGEPIPRVGPARPWRRRAALLAGAAALLALSWAVSRFGWLSTYWQWTLMFMGINIILCASLNLVNGFMGEFSVGHAGFMAVGAYAASVLTTTVMPESGAWRFPLAVLAGGAAAGATGFLVAIPAFRTRGDYLAIVTLAFCMIVKSALENTDALGGARGWMGMEPLTTLPWVTFWTLFTVWVLRNLVYSKYGRGMTAIRDDEVACNLCGVRSRRVKISAFVISAGFAGVAGGLYAHLLLFINPKMFDILKSTDILVMVYLGGMASLSGSILGALVVTALTELLRPLGMASRIIMPLLLIGLMLFRPRGILGLREFSWLQPADPDDGRPSRTGKEAGHAPSAD